MSPGSQKARFGGWLGDGKFIEEYRIARRQCVATTLNNLSRICNKAVETLEEVMSDAEASPSSRVSAAKAILDVVIKVSEQEDTELRIAALEAVVNGEAW